MRKGHHQKLLQVSLGICALAPLSSGLLGLTGIDNPLCPRLNDHPEVVLDSNLRFLNGLSAGIGLYTLTILPNIQKKSEPLQMVCVMIFFGAVGRLMSIARYGFPPFPFILFPSLELLLPLVFILWQSRIRH